MRVPTVDQTNLRRRAAQFGWLTVGLAALAIGLLVVAAVLADDALRALWEEYRPKVDEYVVRALDPDAAP